MVNVNIKFNDKDYLLSCDEGQEENLKQLANVLDKRIAQLKKDLGNLGENKLLLISAIKLIDELFALNKKVEGSKEKISILSNKFKELKSLTINYRDDKEREIEKLKNEINSFKSNIEESQNYYNALLDEATNSIKEFIEKTESNNNLQ